MLEETARIYSPYKARLTESGQRNYDLMGRNSSGGIPLLGNHHGECSDQFVLKTSVAISHYVTGKPDYCARGSSELVAVEGVGNAN